MIIIQSLLCLKKKKWDNNYKVVFVIDPVRLCLVFENFEGKKKKQKERK